MNNNSLKYISIFIIGVFLALFVTTSLFTGTQNKIGGLFKYATALAFIVAVIRPTTGLIILIVSSGYLDMIKRFTTLDYHVTQLDIGIILVFAPILVTGITLNIVGLWFFKPPTPHTKAEKYIFAACTLWACVCAIPILFGSGGLKSMGLVLNYFVYPYLLLLAPRYFSDLKFVQTCMITICVAYLPVMALGIHEGFYGYNDITMDYLLAGYSQEIRQLYDAKPGAMSTLAGPPALSISMVLIGGLLIMPFDFKGNFRIFSLAKIFRWPLAIACYIAAYYTFARTGWVVGIAFFGIMVALVIRNRKIFYGLGLLGVSSITMLYVSSGYLLEIDAMRILQDKMRGKTTNAELDQKTTLATFNGRLESMHAVMEDDEIWTPFGLRFAGLNADDYETHEIVSALLIRFGYVTMLIMGIFTVFAYYQIGKINYNFGSSPESNVMRICLSVAFACFVTVIGHGQTIFSFPINLIWGLFLAMALGVIYHMRMRDAVQNVSMNAGESVRTP